MAYGFNDDKSKKELTKEWTELPVTVQMTGGYLSGRFRYYVDAYGTVCVGLNLDVKREIPVNTRVQIIILPEELKPQGAVDTVAGLGHYRNIGCKYTHNHRNFDLFIDTTTIYLYAKEKLSADGDYWAGEFFYNPTY